MNFLAHLGLLSLSSCLDSSASCFLLLLGLADLASGSPVKPETQVMLEIEESVFSSMDDKIISKAETWLRNKNLGNLRL